MDAWEDCVECSCWEVRERVFLNGASFDGINGGTTVSSIEGGGESGGNTSSEGGL